MRYAVHTSVRFGIAPVPFSPFSSSSATHKLVLFPPHSLHSPIWANPRFDDCEASGEGGDLGVGQSSRGGMAHGGAHRRREAREYFVGVAAEGQAGLLDEHALYVAPGCWGLSNSVGASALRADGRAAGAGVRRAQLNRAGQVFGSGERVGVLADMDSRPRTLQFFRDGARLEGAAVSGFPARVRIAADIVFSVVTATLAFPPAPPPEPEPAASSYS